jgi:iron complex transport system ATP-binding protein
MDYRVTYLFFRVTFDKGSYFFSKVTHNQKKVLILQKLSSLNIFKMVAINHLHFNYGTRPILFDLSCCIQTGDFVALVGPNGAGKSTLIKCICGILKAEKGAISIDGSPLLGYSANDLARTVAYIPQSEKAYTQITVFDAILAGRKPYFAWKPSKNDLKEVSNTLKLIGIEDLSMRYINELSGGQQQAVMIARALVQKTKVLLLDEPTANLDMRHQTEVMNLLKVLSDNKLTIIISVHDINLAFQYASHILMLKEGRVLGYASKNDITTEQIACLYDTPMDVITHNGVLHVVPGSNHANSSNTSKKINPPGSLPVFRAECL